MRNLDARSPFWPAGVGLALTLLFGACGGAAPGQEGGIGGREANGTERTTPAAVPQGDSCALATPEMVAEAFDATSATAEPAETMQGDAICRYRLTGGIIPNVYAWHHGSSAGWDELKAKHETPPLFEDRHVFEKRPGLGDDAFYSRTSLLVRVGVRLDPIQYSVYFVINDVRPPVTGQQLDAALIRLAGAIAGN
jgi:hypothetical protein